MTPEANALLGLALFTIITLSITPPTKDYLLLTWCASITKTKTALPGLSGSPGQFFFHKRFIFKLIVRWVKSRYFQKPLWPVLLPVLAESVKKGIKMAIFGNQRENKMVKIGSFLSLSSVELLQHEPWRASHTFTCSSKPMVKSLRDLHHRFE